jgi:hypothetical protein
LQFKWSDYEAAIYANKLAGKSVPTFSTEYEGILRRDVLATLLDHPGLLWRTIQRKFEFRRAEFLRALAGVAGAFLLLVLWPSRGSWIGAELRVMAFVGTAALSARFVVLLAANYPIYYYPVYAGESLGRLMEPVLIVFAAIALWKLLFAGDRKLSARPVQPAEG